jgi:hypothetical protein
MFRFPESSDEREQQIKQYHSWLVDNKQTDVVILGGGPAALCCGLELLEENFRVLMIDESENPGGRLTWQHGPVEIISPADELLAELGFPISENPPLWLDRLQLLSFLCYRFFHRGGRMLSGVYIESAPRVEEDNVEIHLLVDDRPFIVTAKDAVVTLPDFNPPVSNDDYQQQMKQMVLDTRRREEGWIQAGYQALLPASDYEHGPYVNSCLLSGRKAAHLVFEKLI